MLQALSAYAARMKIELALPSLTRALLGKASLKPFNFGGIFAKKKDS
jgi:hypothetical protein|tara:strand:+ start:292 stop:432 length:141 start_codon:yes stop_codon:yes gene_type:complete